MTAWLIECPACLFEVTYAQPSDIENEYDCPNPQCGVIKFKVFDK